MKKSIISNKKEVYGIDLLNIIGIVIVHYSK